jgi:hypothetical protein
VLGAPSIGWLGERRCLPTRFGLKSELGSQNRISNLNKVLGIKKSKDLNTFKLGLNWSQTRINSNKLFEDFSNLKIDLNIQI